MSKPASRITGLTVCGFKSIASEQSLDIRPLTILAGANSAGKSSFMQAILLLKQTLEAQSDPGALLLDGPNVRFTSAEQVLNRSPGRPCAEGFTVKISVEEVTLDLSFRREAGKGFDVTRLAFTSPKEKSEILPNMTHEQIVDMLPMPWKTIHKDIGGEQKGLHWAVRRDRCLLGFELSSKDSGNRLNFGPYPISPGSMFIPHITGIIHLPGLRGNPRRTYPKTAGGPAYPGTFETYVASVIAGWSEGSEKLKELGSALEEMGLTWKVKAEPVDDTQVELKVARLVHGTRGGAHDLVSIADVGFGVSQSLPVVVALLAARPGQLVYLEQPEIHLHPLAQRRLAGILGQAIKRQVVTVVETHSALLLREIQTLVAQGKIAGKDVKLHWVQRGGDGGTTVTPADLDDHGAYGDWPEDFDQTELQAEQAYLDAVERSGGKK